MTEQDRSPRQILTLPEHRREFARGLVFTYQEDLAAKRLAPVQRMDRRYKVEIIKRLLSGSTVDVSLLSEQIRRREFAIFEPNIFFNACNVLDDLIQTGGANLEEKGLLQRVRES